ncbi:MAG TPA: LysR family transcriptional regulator [Acidiferrobacteraceae bacterium]|nr:LysR family transcriptional regulator [Acidiferrobacteraceae bacterium]
MARLQNMKTFVGVVDSGSFSAAADRLGVAKSAVSRRIADLEAYLGVQLFQRTTRRLNLTDTGRSYYERCVQILADVEETEIAVSQQHAALQGRLRLALPLSFGLRHLGPAIIEFAKLHPAIHFELDFNDRRIDLMQEGFDLAFRIGRLEDSSLIARRIADINTMVCASPGYLKKHGTPQRPEDLEQHDALVYSNLADPEVWAWWDRQGTKHTVRPKVVMRANNGDFLCDAAIAGRGICMHPSFITYDAVARGDLVPILADISWPATQAYALYPATRHLSQRVRAFVDYLVERFEGRPYWDAPAEVVPE